MSTIKYKYVVERNSPCPCLSGKKFKACCMDNLSKEFFERSSDLYLQGNYSDALIAYRAHLSKYTFWYNEHTVPMLKHDAPEGEEYLVMDIYAFISILNSISKCLYNLNEHSEIELFLTASRIKVDDFRYRFYVDVEKAFWLNIVGKENKARKTLLMYLDFDINHLPRSSFSSIYLKHFLDILISDLPLVKCSLIADRILDLAETVQERIEVLATKVFYHFLHKDFRSTKVLIKQIEEEFNNHSSPDPNIINYIKIFRANILEIKGFVYQNIELLNDSVRLFEEIIPSVNDKDKLDSFYIRVAILNSQLNERKKALMYFNNTTNKTLIEQNYEYIKCLIITGELELAQEFLNKIDFSSLEDGIKLDFFSLFAELAIIERNKNKLEGIIEDIKSLRIEVPIFEELRQQTLSHLYSTVGDLSKASSLLDKIRVFTSKYFLLQPSIFGFGININEIIKPKK